jgi:hypothetical protein
MDILAHQITASCCLDDAVIGDSVGHVSEDLAFILERSVAGLGWEACAKLTE